MSSKSNVHRTAAALFCSKTALARDDRGTPDQRAASAPEAFRLYASFNPDPTRVERCLRQNKTDLTDTCRAVFEQGTHPVANRIVNQRL